MTTYRTIPLSRLVMPARPLRGRIDAEGVDELAASIREIGQLDPILVRPLPDDADRFEIVAGHRRALALAKAGKALAEVKIDSELSESHAVAENVAREALTPIDEARAYQRLVDEGLSLPEVAARVGERLPHVTARLRLAALDADTLAMLDEGRIGYAGAALLAGVTADLRAKVVAQMRAARYVDAFSDADIVERLDNAARELDDAPFALDDEGLVEGVVPCTRCPRNTAVQRDLFASARSAVCLDVVCFGGKAIAQAARAKSAAAEAGLTVIEGAEAERLMRSILTDYVRLSTRCHEYQRADADGTVASLERVPTWGEVLERAGRDDVRPVVAIFDDAGVVRAERLLRRRDAMRLLGAVDEAAAGEAAADAEVEDPEQRAKAEAKAKRAEEVAAITLRRLCETAAEPALASDVALRIAAHALVERVAARHVEALSLRREWAKRGADHVHAVRTQLDRDATLAMGVIAELVLLVHREDALSKRTVGSVVHDLLDALEIDVAEVRGEVKRDLEKRDDAEAAKRGEGRVRKRRPKKSEQTEMTTAAPAETQEGAEA